MSPYVEPSLSPDISLCDGYSLSQDYCHPAVGVLTWSIHLFDSFPDTQLPVRCDRAAECLQSQSF